MTDVLHRGPSDLKASKDRQAKLLQKTIAEVEPPPTTGRTSIFKPAEEPEELTPEQVNANMYLDFCNAFPTNRDDSYQGLLHLRHGQGSEAYRAEQARYKYIASLGGGVADAEPEATALQPGLEASEALEDSVNLGEGTMEGSDTSDAPIPPL